MTMDQYKAMYITQYGAYIHGFIRSSGPATSPEAVEAAGELRGRGPAESCSVVVEILARAKSVDFDYCVQDED